jgi:anti-sigma factor RsiW
MSCKELVELVTEYLEGTLPETEKMRFEAHLMTCQGCTNYLAQMRKTLQVVGKLSEEDLSEEAKTELLSVFRNWQNAL